eukprot:COSAG06_NODE_749_length_12615_cov_35.521333_11_plen_994_part_00
MPSSEYSALSGGDDSDDVNPDGGFVPLGRDAISDGEATSAAPAAPAGVGTGVGTTSALQQKLRRPVRETTSASRLRNVEPEVVRLTVHAHRFLDCVSYNGVPLEGVDTEVDGLGQAPASIQKLSFHPTAGGVLAIGVRGVVDVTSGNLRSLLLTCESTRTDSAWNFALTPQNAPFLARALALPEGDDELAPKDWQRGDFDDSGWDAPSSLVDRGTANFSGTDSRLPHAEAVWCGTELKALFRFDVSGKFEAEARRSAPLLSAIVFRDHLQELQKLLNGNAADELASVQERYPWLLALTPAAPVSVASLQSAVADRAHESVIDLLLESTDPAAIKERDEAGDTLLYIAVKANSDLSVILAILERWPEAVREKGTLGTPLHLAASKCMPFETQAQLLDTSASFGQLSVDDLVAVGNSGCLRGLAEGLETSEGLDHFVARVVATPNVIMCCLSLAHAMKHRVAMEPSRRVLLNRTAERLMDVATECGLNLDAKLSRIEDRTVAKGAAQALLQPEPLETLKIAVRLHDIETVSVPWILDFVQTMDGNSLRFMNETWSEGGGTNMNHGTWEGRPSSVERICASSGTFRPLELPIGWCYLQAAANNPLLTVRSPAARFWFDTVVYLVFVAVFSHALLFGSGTPDLGPVVTVYAGIWTAATLMQELGQAYHDPRMHLEDFWNWFELATPLLVGTGLMCDDAATARLVHSLAALMLWIQLLQVLEHFESTGPFVAVIGRMTSLIVNFSVLGGLFTVAWSVGMFALLRDDGENSSEEWATEYRSVESTAFALFRVYLGDFGYSFAGAEHETAACIVYGAYLLLIVVLVLNLLIAILSAEHAEVYEDIDKEFAFTKTKATLRMKDRVDKHELPPPLNLLQLPTTLWSIMRGQGWSSSGQRVIWLCWSLTVVPVTVVLCYVVSVLYFVALAFQVDSFSMDIKRMGLAAWQKILMGLAMLVFSPLLSLHFVIPSIVRLPMLPCKILLGMDIGVLTFEVRSPSLVC